MVNFASSLKAIDFCSDLEGDLVVSGVFENDQRQLVQRQTAAWNAFCARYILKEKLNPKNAHAELNYMLTSTAAKVAAMLDERCSLDDRAKGWSFAGRYLAMQPDSGTDIVRKLSPYSNVLAERKYDSIKLTRRFSEMALSFLAVFSGKSIDDVKINFDWLAQISKGQASGHKKDQVASFIREIKSESVGSFDIWVALWPHISSDFETCVKATRTYSNWARENNDNNWLLQAYWVEIISSHWIDRVNYNCDQTEFVSRAVTPFDFVDSNLLDKGFTDPPQVVDVAPFFHFVKFKKPDISFSDWWENWKNMGCDLNDPNLERLVQCLNRDLSAGKMPDWNVFYSGWGFQRGKIISIPQVKSIEAKAFVFDENLWRISNHRLDVYSELVKRTGFKQSLCFKNQMDQMQALIRGEDILYSDSRYLTWYDYIEQIKNVYLSRVREKQQESFDQAIALSWACQASISFVKKTFYPEVEEWISYADSMIQFEDMQKRQLEEIQRQQKELFKKQVALEKGNQAHILEVSSAKGDFYSEKLL